MRQLIFKLCKLTLSSCLLLNLAVSFSYAELIEPPEHLKEVVKSFVDSKVSLGADESMDVQFDQLSSYNLAQCRNNIEASLPKDHNNQEITSVELTCSGETNWHVYMPVRVMIYTKILVAKTTIAPQEEISPDNIELGVYEKGRLYNGFFKNDDDVVGKVASTVIQPGTALTHKNIQFPIIIHRNQSIDITATKNAVSVSMKGIAKSDGALNSTIKVLNTSSQKTFDAVVVGPNRAEVLL